MSRGEERGTSGSDVPGCASRSGRRRRGKEEASEKERRYRERDRRMREREREWEKGGNVGDTGAGQTETS